MSEQSAGYCGQCGEPVQRNDRFCGNCGAAIMSPPPQADQIISRQEAASHTPSRSRRVPWILAISFLAVLVVGTGALAAVAFQDRLGFLSGPDSPPPIAQGGNEATEGFEEETIVGGLNPDTFEDTGIEQTSEEQTTSETEDGNSSERQETEDFVFDYYDAVEQEDWATTYSLLAESSREEFTEEEWINVQEIRQASEGDPAPLESVETEVTGEFVIGANLTFEDGTTGTTSVLVPPNTGEQGRLLNEEDISYLEGLISDEASTTTEDSDEEAAIEDAIESHYEAIGTGDFYTAYSYFGPTFRSENGEEDWVAEEESFDITEATVNSVEVIEASEGSAQATVDVGFSDNTGTPRFLITWDMTSEDGSWKLDEVSNAEEI